MTRRIRAKPENTEPTVLQTAAKPRVGDGTPGPGRPKGLPNKNTVAVKEALAAAFEGIGGVPALIAWAETAKGRDEFYRLWIKLLPTEINANLEGGITVFINKPPAP